MGASHKTSMFCDDPESPSPAGAAFSNHQLQPFMNNPPPYRTGDPPTLHAFVSFAVKLPRQPSSQFRDCGKDQQCEQLYGDEGHNPAIDLPCSDFGRGNAAQVEKGEAEGWRQEGGLQVDGDHDAQPDRIEAH